MKIKMNPLKGTPTCNPLRKEREGLTAGKKE